MNINQARKIGSTVNNWGSYDGSRDELAAAHRRLEKSQVYNGRKVYVDDQGLARAIFEYASKQNVNFPEVDDNGLV